MSFSDSFSEFKREKNAALSARHIAYKEIYFQLRNGEFGYIIDVVDNHARPTQASYTAYTGAVREVLRQLENIKMRNAFVIDWEKPADHIYLSEHSHLMHALRQCDNLIDAQKHTLQFLDRAAQLELHIADLPENTDGMPMCQAQLIATLAHEQPPADTPTTTDVAPAPATDEQPITDFVFVTESYILYQHYLIAVQNMGSNYQRLSVLNATFGQDELSQYLSLLFTYFDGLPVNYRQYHLLSLDKEEAIKSEPCLIFEKMDTNEALYMRVGQMIEGFSFDFLEQFELRYIAQINEMEQKIVLRPLQTLNLEEMTAEISSLLNRHIRRDRRKMDDVVQSDSLFIIERDVAAAFIYTDLPSLLHKYRVYGAEKLKSYKIATIQPNLQLKLNHGIDFLEGDAYLDFEGEAISLFDAINQYNSHSYILLSDGRQAIVNEAYMRKLQRLFKKKKDKVQISFFDLPLVEDLIDEKVVGSTFAKSRQIFEGFNQINDQATQLPAIQADLRSYQQYGFRWLAYLHQHQLGGCLADDMGLGKTLQALTLLAHIYPNQTELPSLVVMPRTLIFNWENEIQKFAPWLNTYTYYASTRNWQDAAQAQIIFTTYGMVRNEIETFRDKQFYYVILDESQNIKNLTAQATKAVMLLQAQHRLALSGTPIENNLGELYSLFRFLNPPMFGSVETFNLQYATPIQRNNDPNVMKELRKKIYPFILRRLKKDVLTELPDKIEQILYVEMSDRQQKYYDQRRIYYQTAIRGQIADKGLQETRFFIFQALSELRQIASIPEVKTKGKITSPKIETLIEQLFDAIANGHKALIFVNFLAAVELIAEQLQQAKVDFVSMTGATHDRQSLVHKFQTDPNCKVFLMTLKTGGTGLNLTAADMVFIFDPWWNQAAESQAIDRTHRMGQTQKVASYKMITRGTIEEKILKLQQVKQALFDSVISSDSGSLKALTESDIQFMLS